MAKSKGGPETEGGNPDGCVIGKKEAKTLTASVQVLSDAFLSGAQSIRTSLTLLSDTISEMASKIKKVSEGFNRTRKTTSARKEKGETVQESGIKATTANKANANQAKEKPGFVIRTFRSLFGFSQKGQHPGSIYTHDIHCEKILIQIASLLTQAEKTSKPKGSKSKSKSERKKKKTDLDLQIDELRSKFPILTKLFIDGPAKLKEEFKYWSGIMSSGWGVASKSIKTGSNWYLSNLSKAMVLAYDAVKSGSSLLTKSFKLNAKSIVSKSPVTDVYDQFKDVFDKVKFRMGGFVKGSSGSAEPLGQYDPNKKGGKTEIRLNAKKAGQDTVLHEMVHAIDFAAGQISEAAINGSNRLSDSLKEARQFVLEALSGINVSEQRKEYAAEPTEVIANFVTASQYAAEAGSIMEAVFNYARETGYLGELNKVIDEVTSSFFDLARASIDEIDAKKKAAIAEGEAKKKAAIAEEEARKKAEEEKKTKERNMRGRKGTILPKDPLMLASGGPATPSKDDAKGTDTVPAMLTPGEFVVNKDATKKNRGVLEQINNGGKTQKRSSGGPINYLAGGGVAGGGGGGGGGTAQMSYFMQALSGAGKGLGMLGAAGQMAVGAITGTVGAFSQITAFAGSFVQAFNPALMEQMNLVFRDLTAVIGMGLEPVIGAVIPIVRAFADKLVPVMQAMIPTVQLFADSMIQLAGPIIEILIQAFAALEPIIVLAAGIVEMWAGVLTWAVPLIAAVIKEVVYWFTKIVSTVQYVVGSLMIAIGKVLAMIPGTGNAGKDLQKVGENAIESSKKASKATDDYYNGTSKVQKAIQKPMVKGASVGAAAGKASFSGISDLGRNLMQSAMSSSTQASAIRTAENTQKTVEVLTKMDERMSRVPLPNPAAPARGARN
jgi:hypothetical protein